MKFDHEWFHRRRHLNTVNGHTMTKADAGALVYYVVKPSPLFTTRRRFCICIQAFTCILNWNLSQDDTMHFLQVQCETLTIPFQDHTASRQLFRGLNIEEDCSAIYQIYPRIICVYKTCKIRKKCKQQFINFNF